MGNLCSGGLLDTDTNRHVGMYNDYSKYTAQHPVGNQAVVNNSIEQKRSSHSSSPDRRRQGARDGQIGLSDEPEVEQEEQQWRSPAAAPEQPSAEAAGQEVAEEQPPEPFSWTKGELIGIGAFGRVFSALNNSTGELVAVKQVSFARDEALQGRVAEHIKALEAEVEVLKTLKHENIVRYLGTEITEDSLYIFLEYVPGGSIASLLAKFGAFPEKVIRVYTAQLLRGLEYLHQRGIMHRDIKGANILVDKQGTVKLADFGASKKIEDLATMGSGSKSIRGTPYWMAPEVIKQTGHGRPADIWSLACTVIEMATGKPPWNNYTAPVAAMFQIASSKDPPPLPENLSREAKDFLLLCFNRVARDRANATRLLKHPFVAGVLDQPRQVPAATTPPSNAVGGSSSSPGAPLSGGSTPSRLAAGTSAASAAVAPQHSGRQSTAAMANGVHVHRPPAVGAMSAAQAAMKASRQSRSSPTQARSSPMRQQQHPADGTSAGPPIAQRGDAAAVLTAARSPLQPQPQQLAAQQHQQPKQEQLLQKAQQQQQSPKPFDSYRQQQQQQQHTTQPQQPQQQQQQQHAEGSSRASPAAPSAEASSASDVGQDACMTLVDWNPVSEPSWLPPYQPQPSSSKRQHAAAGVSSQPQQQPQATADKQVDGYHRGPSSRAATSAAPSEPPDAEAHRPAAASGRGPGLSSSIGAAPGQPAKRATMLTNSSNNSSSASKRGIGNSGAGPLSQGPAGRASSIMNGLNTGMGAPAGGSILAGVGGVEPKPRPAGSILQQAGSLHTAASGSSSSGPPPAVTAAGAEDQAAPHDQWGSRATAATAAAQPDEDMDISSKRVQWENELYEELERHRKEQRVARQANQAARLSAMQQQ